MLISNEGPDMSGKSTQVKILKKYFENENKKVKTFSFPDDNSLIGNIIRQILTSNSINKISKIAFQYLYIAEQTNMTNEILEYLKNDYVVILDRYDLSSLVYAVATSNGDHINDINTYLDDVTLWNAIADAQKFLLIPDITFVYDLENEVMKERKEVLDKFESNEELMKTVCHIYSNIDDYISDKREIKHIDASKTKEDVTNQIINCIKEFNTEDGADIGI